MTSMRVSFTTLAMAALFIAGCAPSTVQTSYERAANLPRPTTILIYDFAVSADEVHLDRGLVGDLANYQAGTPRTEQEIALGRKVARAISTALVSEINAMGLPAQRAWGAPANAEGALVIEGALLSINEGNQAERVAIGLGAGASDIEARTQLYTATPYGLEPLEKFTTTEKSGYMPGMAETMGAGAIGGHLAVAAVAGAGMHAVSEKFSGDISAEATRTAKAIAKQLRTYFQSQNWIMQD